MKAIIADAVEVAPKEGTIIRFEDRGLVVIGIYVGHSDNGHMVVILQRGSTSPGTLKTYNKLPEWSSFDWPIIISNG